MNYLRERVFFFGRKKPLMPSLLYGFSHQSGSLINRDSEKKVPGGVFFPSLDIQASISIIYLTVPWVEMEQMQITGSYTKCVLHQPLFNMYNALCLHSFTFSSLVPKDQSSKYSVLMGSRNKYRIHSNFLSPRSILN